MVFIGALTFIAPHFWTFTKIGKTGRCSVENYYEKTMTRASTLDLWGETATGRLWHRMRYEDQGLASDGRG
jgi:hypothetical protein